MLPSILPLLSLLVLTKAAPLEERQAANPTVTISNGVVIGTATGVLNQPSVTGQVNAFLGVPYAIPPTGSLRFAPPEPASPWTTPLNAQTLPPACLQQFMSGAPGQRTRAYFNNPGLPPPAEDEDCLYLNVFSPTGASPTNLKSVMFWIYGGNNQFGTASLAYYNGSSLAVNEDVVVVAINYRTNIFGFSSSPQIPFGQQNSAYLDQRLALQWVQQNIREFGGDPSKVTLFGESAGGHDIKQLLALPPSPLPFRAAIMQSQNVAAFGSGLTSYNRVLANFGCTGDASPIDCLRRVPATDIQRFIGDEGITFPEVTGDGTSVGKQSIQSIINGRFARVPILIGTNADEATVFVDVAGLGSDLKLINDTLSPLGIDTAFLTNGFIRRYYPNTVGAALVSRVLTDFLFTCSTRTLSDAIKLSGRPIWRYLYAGSFPNLTPFPNAGAWHSSEIPSVFGTYPTTNEFGTVTQDQIALSSYMQGVWAGFAKNPSQGAPWPRLGSAFGVELGVLGGTRAPRGQATRPLLERDAPCAVYGPLLIAAGQAY